MNNQSELWNLIKSGFIFNASGNDLSLNDVDNPHAFLIFLLSDIHDYVNTDHWSGITDEHPISFYVYCCEVFHLLVEDCDIDIEDLTVEVSCGDCEDNEGCEYCDGGSFDNIIDLIEYLDNRIIDLLIDILDDFNDYLKQNNLTVTVRPYEAHELTHQYGDLVSMDNWITISKINKKRKREYNNSGDNKAKKRKIECEDDSFCIQDTNNDEVSPLTSNNSMEVVEPFILPSIPKEKVSAIIEQMNKEEEHKKLLKERNKLDESIDKLFERILKKRKKLRKINNLLVK